MAEFEKIKVSINQSTFENELSKSKGRIYFYQEIINQVKEVVPNIALVESDLIPLFNDPKSFLVDKIITEPTEINGLTLCKEKVFELLTDSERLKTIVNNVERLKSNSNVENERNLHVYTKDYEITDAGEVVLKQASIDALESRYSIYLTSQGQKDAHDSLVIILNELNKLNNAYHKSHVKFIEDYFIQTHDGSITGINYNYLHTL